MLPTAHLHYHLPDDRVARAPAHPRDAARLMVLSRADETRVEHRRVRDLAEYLNPGDLLVVNASRVLAARVLGVRADTGGSVEGLFLDQVHGDPSRWRIMLKGRRMKPGVRVDLFDRDGNPANISLYLIERSPEEGEEGAWVVDVVDSAKEVGAAAASPLEILERIGLTPLPPYIRAARKRLEDAVDEAADRRDYQTTYAAPETAATTDHPLGSVAAPTAGLHFTPELLATLAARGVNRADVTLHVGTGTFKTVETEFVEQHPMHSEWCTLPAAAARAILATRAAGHRVVAVGTTTARTLESFPPHELAAAAETGEDATRSTRLLITPGYTFNHLDALMTNFHLPASTLLALVAAMLPQGIERLKHHYAEALATDYRFFSYGDAMLIL